MATAVSRFQLVSCCTTITWQPSASVAGRPTGCPTLFPGTRVGAVGRVGVFQPPNAVFRPQVISKEARHHSTPAVRCAAQVASHDRTAQLTKCAPEEQEEMMGTSPIVDLFGPAFLSGGTEQVHNAVALFLESYQEPLIEAPPAGTVLPLHASCHIRTGSGETAEEQSLQAHVDALSEEQALLEASFQAPHDGPLLLPDSLDLRLSSHSPVAAVDEPPPENTIQKLQNMLMDTARLLGALLLASALALCTPHPALAARSMGRAGGGGFSSSRSSGGSSRSSSSSSSRSGSSSSSRSSSSSSSRSSSSSSGRSSSSSSRRASSSSGSSSGLGFHWGSTPKSSSSSHSSDSHGHSSGHSNTGGHSPSHSDTHEKSGVKAWGGGAAGKSPRPKPPPSSSEKHRWSGGSSHEPEEPHLNSHSYSDTSASIHVHLGGPTWPQPSSHPGAYHYSDTHDRLLRAFFRGLSGEDRSKETGGQQQAGTEAPGPKEAAADAEALNATFGDVLTIFGITVLGFLVIMILALWAEDYENRMRENPRNDNTGTVREGSGYAVADASRAVERARADVSKSRAPEGTRVYDFDTNVKNLITVVKVQVALLGQAKSVQLQMDKLCEEADTGSKEGLHHLLTETLLVILRHSTHWAYGNAQMIPLGYDAAERRYQQISLEERSKAEQETLVNKGGKLTKMPSVRDTDEEAPPNEFIVVTVLAAVKSRLEARDGADRVSPRENVKGAVQALSQVQADDLEVLDILWVPQEDDDILTHAELIENFTDLSPM